MRSRHVKQACAGMAALLVSVLSVVGCGNLTTESPTVVPLLGMDQPNVIKDQYFVILPAGTAPDVVEGTKQQILDLDGDILLTYESLLLGFAAHVPPESVEALRRNPDIAYIEADRALVPNGIQTCAPWNLDRIDQKSGDRDGVYAYGATGLGIDVYVVDTGIDAVHPELRPDPAAPGRVKEWIKPEDGAQWSSADSSTDCNGHGTLVAGVVAGQTLGVAKQAGLYSVRVVEGCACGEEANADGSVIAKGIELIAMKHQANHPGNTDPPPAVAVVGYSVSGSSGGLETALDNAIKANIIVVVSAGNDGVDACNYTPAKLDNAITVGALDENGASPIPGSNNGPCVDIFAPGIAVRSTASKDAQCYQADAMATSTIVMDGTSVAAAHVAGVAALYAEDLLEISTVPVTGTTVWGKMKQDAVTGAVVVEPDSVNLSLYSAVNTAGTEGADADGCNDGFKACLIMTCAPEMFCPNGAPCCDGMACGAGGVWCADGDCEACGTREAKCCRGAEDQRCLPAFECNADGLCSCGDLNELCCDDVPKCFSESQTLVCGSSGRCVECGGFKDICCDGDLCNSDNLACNASKECVACGIQDHPCCGSECATGLACDSSQVSPTCQPCGGPSQICCKQQTCGAGYQCSSSNTCELCGGANQLCCGQTCDPGHLCNDAGVCQPCGQENQACCGTSCSTSLECVNGMCINACGSAGQGCCTVPPWPKQCDDEMVCNAFDSCQGLCYARCKEGQLLKHPTHLPTAGACVSWADFACLDSGSGHKLRVQYNGNDAFYDPDCGTSDNACCDVGQKCDVGLSCMTDSTDVTNPDWVIVSRSWCQ